MTILIPLRAYRAPEALYDHTYVRSYGTALDMWSAGCIFAELFKGEPLLTSARTVDTPRDIITNTLGATFDGFRTLLKERSVPTESLLPNDLFKFKDEVSETFFSFFSVNRASPLNLRQH